MPHVSDPGLFALRGAIRAAVVMPATFAFARVVFDDPQTELFAAFGSIALLVLVDFTGPRRVRLGAYLALALVGAVLIPLGTLCSGSPALGALAMLIVAFVALLAGVVNGYLAAGATAGLLTFILPVMVPAGAEDIPARLVGWGLACTACIPALLLVWPARPPSLLRAGAATACRALADLVLDPSPPTAAAAREAIDALRRRFLGTPYRPTGPTGATGALAGLVEELGWVLAFAMDRPLAPDTPERATVVAALRDCAGHLEGSPREADADSLRAAMAADAAQLRRRLADPALRDDDAALLAALRSAFDGRLHCALALRVVELSRVARGGRVDADERPWRQAGRLLVDHATPRSVWFRNSLRAAVGLALAVLVAQEMTFQHAFWVVLGALSVLRSSALSTGSTILRALAGTAAGIVVGGLLVVALGDDPTLLWIALPFAVGLGAYAPRAVSFAAGQAAFTVVVLVLFNLIDPVGWSVGLVRIEDVAVGFAISLGVGLLFWPRGAIGALRDALAAAYEHGAAHAAAAFERLFVGGSPVPSRALEVEAVGAGQLLDAAFRQALAERGAGRVAVVPAARLVAGAVRLRQAAEAANGIEARVATAGGPPGEAAQLVGDVVVLRSWYAAFAAAFAQRHDAPALRSRADDGVPVMLAVVREAAASGDDQRLVAALGVAWGNGYLNALYRMEARVAEAGDLTHRPQAAGESL